MSREYTHTHIQTYIHTYIHAHTRADSHTETLLQTHINTPQFQAKTHVVKSNKKRDALAKQLLMIPLPLQNDKQL